MTNSEERKRTHDFVTYWTGKGYEKGESQKFWLSLLALLGVNSPEQFISFEDQVRLDHTSFIDGFIPSTHVLIEQKSIGKDLRAPIKQSDGTLLTPFQQAKRYAAELPYSERPRWIVTCNFQEFLVYDMEQPNGEPASILLENLEKELYRLHFLVHTQDATLQQEMEISLAAGELVGRLYDALLAQYIDPASPHALHSLNALCVRLVFCLYAEDAGLFASHTAFHDYLASFRPENMRKGLIDLFKMLDTPTSRRDPYERPELLAFPYVNGGLFADETIEIPRFTSEILHLLLKDCSADFDWSGISPTIFGAVFESTLNPETRRSGGMHYTSIENIHKVIDPLFLSNLNEQIDSIERTAQARKRERLLLDFQEKLASLRFLDPACGSGNFLTETFLSLRRLENRVLKLMRGDNAERSLGGDFSPIKVSISQFYGIEINDFAATVAKTALWIAESQMMKETEDIVGRDLDFLPLKTYTNITEGNALRIDWESVVPKDKLSYIMGNPPFVGAYNLSEEQKKDRESILGKDGGTLDYVCCWYKKAASFIDGNTRCAFVSTNSITQGQQVAPLWKPLFADGIHINFAYQTFVWDSEASLKAHVHCVIIGFSKQKQEECILFSSSGDKSIVGSINGYLHAGEPIFVEKHSTPICDVPEMAKGFQATDGGNLILSEEEKDEIIRKNPDASRFIRRFSMGADFIQGKLRYVLWLPDASPKELRQMPEVMKRVEACKTWREQQIQSGDAYKLKDTPWLLRPCNKFIDRTYIGIPKVSSSRRRYVPFGFINDGTIPGDKLYFIPTDSLYIFGIMMSNVQNAWMRLVAGRLKSDYSYSNTIVYNNFPWPAPTEEQRQHIEQTAQQILDARALYPDSSLADLYDETLMPPELRRAHQQNDRAVMSAYGFPVKDFSESDCVARLMELYKELAGK